jgi:hypothetical protein
MFGQSTTHDFPFSHQICVTRTFLNLPLYICSFLLNIYIAKNSTKSRDISVSIVTGYGLDDLGLILGMGMRFFSSPQCPDRFWVLSNEYRGLFPRGVKQQECEVDHSPPSSAEVKNHGVIPPLPHMPSWHNA